MPRDSWRRAYISLASIQGIWVEEHNAYPLPEIPCLNLKLQATTAAMQHSITCHVEHEQMLFLFLLPSPGSSWASVRVCVLFLTHKPKNKGPCVRSAVYGSQAPAASMPLLRDSSCWPDIAWLERKEATVLQPALFVHRLALPFPSRVFFNDNSRKKVS